MSSTSEHVSHGNGGSGKVNYRQGPSVYIVPLEVGVAIFEKFHDNKRQSMADITERAAITATTTAAPPPNRIERPRGNPKDSIKSTWREADRSTWSMFHWIFHALDVHPVDPNQKVPVHSKDEPVPYMPGWYFHRFILVYAAIPVLIHHLYTLYFGRNPHVMVVYFFYSSFLNINAIHEVRILRRLGHKYGFLDGDKHERDGIPDVAVKKLFLSLFQGSHIRPMLAVILSYSSSQLPSSINWKWLFLEIACYALAVDFWFYWYHRMMHDIDGLWKFHRTHHLTKHPSPLLAIYADSVQEVFDVILIPLLGFGTMKLLGFPMGFYETWFCYEYVIFTEVLGHSGLRIHATAPSPLSWLYHLVGLEGVIEDHDLHHRNGWRKSHSYGKHCAIFDKAFGTSGDRIEGVEGNIDWKNTATFPLF